MRKDNTSGGWRPIEIKDSFIMCPIGVLPEPIRREAYSNIGEYWLMFAQTMEERRLDAPVLLPDFLSNQPLHRHATVVTNFEKNKVSLLEAIEHDRRLAQMELTNVASNLEARESAQMFLNNLNLIVGVIEHGNETDAIPEDVQVLLPSTLLQGGKPTDSVEYFSREYSGFRPV